MPVPPRPLHNQLLIGQETFITEQMDMHLAWTRYLRCEDTCACSDGEADFISILALIYTSERSGKWKLMLAICCGVVMVFPKQPW